MDPVGTLRQRNTVTELALNQQGQSTSQISVHSLEPSVLGSWRVWHNGFNEDGQVAMTTVPAACYREPQTAAGAAKQGDGLVRMADSVRTKPQ